jgi:ATP-dependent Lhr-like helicase
LTDLRARKVRVTTVDTPTASPMAQSLLFGWVGQYMYEYDAPLAERRAAALALDPDLLRELLGGDELRDLLDADVLARTERELQRLGPTDEEREAAEDPAELIDRLARDVDQLHDVLRAVGSLSREELADRAVEPADPWSDQLLEERRAIAVRVGGDDRIAAAEDAARLRDAIGVAIPAGLPVAFTDPVEDPLADLVRRYALTHGPFTTQEVATRLHVPASRVAVTCRHLDRTGVLLEGEFRPHGSAREWVHVEVLRRLKRRSLAALRREVEPVDPAALGRFLPSWHGVIGAAGADRRRGLDRLVDVVAQLQAAPIPASVLEADVLPSRVDGYRPSDLDQLIVAGEVVWLGTDPIGARDGRIVLCFRDQVDLLVPVLGELREGREVPDGPLHGALRDHLGDRGASFWPELLGAASAAAGGIAKLDEQEVLDALWDLVWAGEVTNDTYAPVRAFAGQPGGRRAAGGRARPRPGRIARRGPPAAQGRWSLTSELLVGGVSDTERASAVAELLLERHGVLTRESMRAESVHGGFSTVYPVLKALEEAGRIRRGYVVAGSGAAQFAAPGAIDRLRALRDPDPDGRAPVETLVLAATDPAQPYGAALAWPDSAGRPARAAGAMVVLTDGVPALTLDRGGRSLTTFPAAEEHAEVALQALFGLVDRGRLRKLEITRVDGVEVHDTPWADRLETAGGTRGYRGVTYRGTSRDGPARGGNSAGTLRTPPRVTER